MKLSDVISGKRRTNKTRVLEQLSFGYTVDGETLAARTGLTQKQVSRAVKALVKEGWVKNILRKWEEENHPELIHVVRVKRRGQYAPAEGMAVGQIVDRTA